MHRPNVCVSYSITTRSVKRWAWWMRREWQIPSYWSTPASTETSLSLWTTVQRSLERVRAAAAAYFTVSVSVFTAIFQVDLGYPVFIEATDDGSGWCSWNYRSCKLQSSSQIVTTNKPTPSFFTCRMPFLSPNQQCQIKSLKGIISLSMNLLTPTSPGGRPTFVSDH